MNIKKLLSFALLAVALVMPASAAVISTNITATAGSVFLLTTNRASVYSVELTGTVPCLVDFYDCDSTAAPFYGTNSTNAAWISRSTYPTNMLTTMVGYNGYTNYYTNVGLYTASITNAAATNALPKQLSLAVAGNAYAVFNTDALFSRGISVMVSTNVTITINYKPAM